MVSDSNTFRGINTAPEVEQPVQEDTYGLSLDDLLLNTDEPDDLSLFYPETILSNNYLQQQPPCDDEFMRELLSFSGGNSDDVFPNPEIMMVENNNNHRPRKPLTGIIVDCSSSDSDAESISETVQHMDKKSSSSSSMVKTEKKGWFITEEAMQINRKNPPFIYLMNMIVGFILLVAVVGNIISVLLRLKTSTH